MKVTYRCTNCGAEDSDRQTYGPAPDALICWSCREGAKLTIRDQVEHRIGMLPLYDEMKGNS